MRKIQIIGLALVAMFAFSAFASSAWAADEWLVGGNPVTTKVASTAEGSLKLCDDKGGIFGEKVCIECSGKSKGTIGPAAADEVTEVTDLAGNKRITNCVNLENCGTAEAVEAENLPWPTKIVLEGTEFRDTVGAAGKEPGYFVECSSFGFKVQDLCEGEANVKLENVAGGVNATFEENRLPATCTRGGVGQGLTSGTSLNIATGGLTVS
jgi:hypothetical protein